jgi:hypothetical protein
MEKKTAIDMAIIEAEANGNTIIYRFCCMKQGI